MYKRFIVILAVFLALLISHAVPCADIFVPAAQAQIGAGAQRAPAIDVDNKDNLYLMMSAATKQAVERTPGSQIFFTKSSDFGANWDNVPFTRNLSNSRGEAFGPSLFVTKKGKTKIYVTYHDSAPGNTQAFLIRSKKGVKFKAPKNITPHNGGAFTPRIAVDSAEALHVVWGDTLNGAKRVVFTRSLDLGASFSEPVDISHSTGNAFEPEIAVDSGDGINVVWEDDREGAKAIMVARSTDGGASFSTPLKISQGTGEASEPHIAADDSGRAYVSWVQEVDGTLQAFFTRSTDGGASFSAPVNLTNEANADIHKVFITTFEDVVYVAYNNDNVSDRQVHVLRSTDAGVSFGQPRQVSSANRNRGRGHSVSMVVDSRGTLHVVWIDDSVIGNQEGFLYYRKLSNGGAFSQTSQILAFIQL
jgi:hypothetical protein